MIIGGLASLALGVTFAVTVGGASSIIFMAFGPLMAGVAVAERLIERRADVGRQKNELATLWSRQISPQEFMSRSPQPLTWWQLGLPPSPERLVRLGVSNVPWRRVVAGAGRSLCQRVMSVDPRGGIEVIGTSELVPAVATALRIAIAREFSVAEGRPIVSELGGTHPTARWMIDVSPRGSAQVVDRLGLEGDFEVEQIDLVTESEQSVLALIEDRRQKLSLSELDLFEFGPHALVSGATGSGKTEFLVAWLAQLAQVHDERNVAIAVIDFKGGGSFARLGALPHLRHLVSDLNMRGLDAAREGIESQISAREHIMAEHAVSDIGAVPSAVRPARIVLVVDEYRALIRSRPEWREALTDLAARGRALGLHLVLATQRFGSLASEELTANIGLRVVFRPGDQAESQLLLGSSAAWDHHLRPGQAIVRAGASGTKMLDFSMWQPQPRVNALGAVQPPLWCVPLRERPRSCDAPKMPTSGGSIFLGLAPDHRALAHVPLWWRPSTDGVLLLIGADLHARLDIGAVVTGRSDRILSLPTEAALAWDAIEAALDNTEDCLGLVAPDVDALMARMPPSWRDECVDRLMTLVYRLLAKRLPVLLGFTSEGSLSARVHQLSHLRVESIGPEGNARCRGGFFTVVVPDESAEQFRFENDIPALSSARITGVLITSRPGFWNKHTDSQLELVSVDQFVAKNFASPVDLESTPLFIDDISPAEFRALRVSSRTLGPPHPQTIFEVRSDGRLQRWNVSALDNRSDLSDRPTAAKHIEV